MIRTKFLILKRGLKAKSKGASEAMAVVLVRLALTPSFLTQPFQRYSTSNFVIFIDNPDVSMQ